MTTINLNPEDAWASLGNQFSGMIDNVIRAKMPEIIATVKAQVLAEQSQEEPPKYISAKEYCAEVGVRSINTLYEWIREGVLMENKHYVVEKKGKRCMYYKFIAGSYEKYRLGLRGRKSS